MTAFLAAVQSSDPDSSAGTFYALAALSMLAMWAVLSAGCGFSDFYRRGTHCPLFTRPSWLPRAWLRALHRRPRVYLALCHCAPLALALAARAPASRARRLGAALALSAYALAESSVTGSHRDHANVYLSLIHI